MSLTALMENLEVSFVESIEDIGKQAWNELAGTDNPFTRYEFLHALELTGCTSEETGWQPQHLTVHRVTDGERRLTALVPLYLKTNSWGEYVFDWSWANAYKSYGFQYYPKFVTAAPFTPSVGKRVFVNPKYEATQSRALLELISSKIQERAEVAGISSWHVLFPTEEEHDALQQNGIQSRIASQFHWYNKSYENFTEFLATLNSRKRKSIRKERQHIAEQGITFSRTEGREISAEQWADFNVFYQSTYAMRGMQGYLKQSFFETIASTMPEQLLMINAIQDGRDIAAALFFKNREILFGRYWGSLRDQQFLHFETCFYQGQDYAIEHGMTSFDSGAQGEHKIQRGFEPIVTYSNHWLANQAFTDAIGNFLREERPHIKRYIEDARTLLPYKST